MGLKKKIENIIYLLEMDLKNTNKPMTEDYKGLLIAELLELVDIAQKDSELFKEGFYKGAEFAKKELINILKKTPIKDENN